LACARADEDFDEMEKLQKDIEKINREVNLSKELYSKNYGNLTDLNKRNKSLNVQLDMQVRVR
jgi:septal ring factor EnvC (AmiA/AmiB activator)